MLVNPFSIFRPFPKLTVTLWTKEDDLRKDMIGSVITDQPLAVPREVHGNRTVIVRGPMAFTERADGLATDRTSLTLAILMADCQAFVAFAPQQGVIGLLHCGWRGLISGAIPSFVQTLTSEWSIAPADLLVAAGPSLCQACSQFTDPLRELPGIDPRFFQGRCADLQGIADDQWQQAGIPSGNRERHPDCTRCTPDRYWSYRGPDRDRVIAGYENMLTVALERGGAPMRQQFVVKKMDSRGRDG